MRVRVDGQWHISFPTRSRSSLMLDQRVQGRGLIAVEADPDRASARKRASARSGSAMIDCLVFILCVYRSVQCQFVCKVLREIAWLESREILSRF